jgi:Ca-activated chloride channel homolog
MQRWHFTAGLAGATALAALLAPSLKAHLDAPVEAPQEPITAHVVAAPTLSPGDVALRARLDQTALLQGSGEDRFLVIEVEAAKLMGDVRRPVDLAVVMDVSGSMAAKGKIENARMAAAELVGQLQTGDRFSLVTFSDRAQVQIAAGPVGDSHSLLRVIEGIRPGGGTHIYDGLAQGIAQLDRPEAEGVRRVVLLSDGMANIGVTDNHALASLAGSRSGAGIAVSTIGLGLEFNEDLLTSMSDAGGGSYHFVDRDGQLAQLFQDELLQMTQLAGRETTLTIGLAPGVELVEVYGYEGSRTGDGYQVFLGDVHGGETRKLVARLRVPDGTPGAVDIASVGLRYQQPDSGANQGSTAAVAATVTASEAVARASIDSEVGTKAARAAASKLMTESAAAWDKGDIAGNQAKLEEGQRLLADLSTRYDAPALMADADEFEKTAGAFEAATQGSDDALYQVKKVKEQARGSARR